MKTKWNLNLILSKETLHDIEVLRTQVEKETQRFITKWKTREDYLSNPKILKQALDEYEAWLTDYGTHDSEAYYYSLMQSIDLNNAQVKADFNTIYKKSLDLWNQIQFFELNISKIKPPIQKKMLASKDLVEYKHFLEQLFRSGKHTLSELEERIMNMKAKVSHSNWTQMLQGLLAKQERAVLDEAGKKRQKNFSEILELMSHKKKKIRDTAANAFNDILLDHLDIAENEFNAVLENKRVNDDLRKYSRPDESRHIADDVSADIVDTLANSVSERFSIAQRFYKLKASLVGVEKLEYHERNVEIGKTDIQYPYEKAYTLVHTMLQRLDTSFSERFVSFHKNGQIDVFPKNGKRSGAFCSFESKKNPVYILLNHVNSLNNVLTVAHEFGHALHFELSRVQNSLNFRFPMATAETSSTFFEDFVLEEIIQEVDEEMQLSIMMMKLNDDVSTIFRQIAFYNFETDVHKAFRQTGYVSKVDLGKIFQKHMKAYMGKAVDQSEGSENWWIYVSHFRSFFYVYSYAFGLLVSKALQRLVKDDPKNIENVKTFLSSGSSQSPKDLFKKLGIDITKVDVWNEGLDEVESLLERTEKLARKLGKI